MIPRVKTPINLRICGTLTRIVPFANLVSIEIPVIANWNAPIKFFSLNVSAIDELPA
jgi:hypothetical protein